MCDAGLYCSTPGLSHPNGICTPGFYCPEGTFFLKDEHDLNSVVYTISFGLKFLPFQVIFSFLFVFQPFCVSFFPLPPSLVLMFSSLLTPLLFHLLSSLPSSLLSPLFLLVLPLLTPISYSLISPPHLSSIFLSSIFLSSSLSSPISSSPLSSSPLSSSPLSSSPFLVPSQGLWTI